MKKTANVLAFIIITGFIGTWECGNMDFKTLLLNVGITLSILFTFHLFRIIFKIIKIIRKTRRMHVKIS